MTLAELYFRNSDIDMCDKVVLHIGRHLVKGKLYQLNSYMNMGVIEVFGCDYYLSHEDNGRKGFREFCRIYHYDIFKHITIDLFDNGVFKGTIKVEHIMKDARYDDRRFSFRNNAVFLDNNLL